MASQKRIIFVFCYVVSRGVSRFLINCSLGSQETDKKLAKVLFRILTIKGRGFEVDFQFFIVSDSGPDQNWHPRPLPVPAKTQGKFHGRATAPSKKSSGPG